MGRLLAYFLTWTTYGTWLRGDARGWAEIGEDGVTRYAEPDPERVAADRGRLKHEPIVLSPDMRQVIDQAIRDGCDHRGWRLHAVNVRSNHVHAVVSANREIDRVLADLKAWGTRRLREQGFVAAEARIWTRHGSTRFLNSPASLAAAMDYVGRFQDGDRFEWQSRH
jgi:REP element-mobilizing transposase RayT